MTHTIDTLMALAMEAASAELAWDIGSSKHPHDKRIYGVDEANAALHAALTEALTFRPDWADFANGRECGRLEAMQSVVKESLTTQAAQPVQEPSFANRVFALVEKLGGIEHLESLHSKPVWEPANWYCIDKSGMATLCADEADALQNAKLAALDWPNNAPYRAVQLVETHGIGGGK